MSEEKAIGYVYVLTNEKSFGHADWVKIGKTSNSVEQRMREMATGAPYSFRKFASLKTAKFNEIEDAVHKIIETTSPDLRLNADREFFKIDAFNAAALIQIVSNLLGEDGKVEFFRYIDDTEELDNQFNGMYYSCELSGADATGYQLKDSGGFIVTRGSRMGPAVPSFKDGEYRRRLFDAKIVDGKTLEFLEDHKFRSAAEAARVVMGRPQTTNAWKDIRGQALQ